MKSRNVFETFPLQAAGVRDVREAFLLARSGFTHIGFPLGPGVVEQDVDPQEAAHIVRTLEGNPQTRDVACVLITYLREPAEILALLKASAMRAVQLHAPVPAADVARLRVLAPELTIFKSIVVGRVEEGDPLAAARAYAPHVDALLTDTFDPRTGASGATGRTHDWDVSRALVRADLGPVILAGGLHPGNVAGAVRAVRPAGVDAHTGLEDAQGNKDPEKSRLFVRNALGALRNAR